jgi:hypothetical protein
MATNRQMQPHELVGILHDEKRQYQLAGEGVLRVLKIERTDESGEPAKTVRYFREADYTLADAGEEFSYITSDQSPDNVAPTFMEPPEIEIEIARLDAEITGLNTAAA